MSSVVKRKAQENDERIRQLAAQSAEQQILPTPDGTNAGDLEPIESEVVTFVQQDTELRTPLPDEASDQQPVENAMSIEDEVAALKAEAEKANQRWRSLQGQIGSKDKQIEQLHTLIANMNTAPAAEEPTRAPVPMGYTKADEDAFGEDMIDVVERIARSVASAEIAEIKRTMEGVTHNLQNVEAHTAKAVKSQFDATLTALAPNWEQLNNDDDFIAWLTSSPTRQNLFAGAVEQKDAEAVAEVFNIYNQAYGKPVEDAKQMRRQKKLENQIAPGRSRSTATNASSQPEEKRAWTKSEIQAVYNAKGQYSKDDFAKLEREIATAMKADRVDYTK
jgi:hypothetical protein